MDKIKSYFSKYIVITVLLAILFSQFSFAVSAKQKTIFNSSEIDNALSAVSIEQTSSHYNVFLDYSKCSNHELIGYAYGKKVCQLIPNFQYTIDSYMTDIIDNNKFAYNFMLLRTKILSHKINKKYSLEIRGMSRAFAEEVNEKKIKNKLNDKKISYSELMALNLIPDIARITQCSAFSAWGDKTINNQVISGRSLDWPCGENYQLSKVQAIITMHHSNYTLTSIGVIGYLGAISMINDSGVFSAILDSPTLKRYSIFHKYSYPFDLRYAMENFKDADSVAKYMTQPKRNYCFSHLIFINDKNKAEIVENNTNKNGKLKTIRYSDTKLQKEFTWTRTDSIACVNCFASQHNINNKKNSLTNYNLLANKQKNSIDDNSRRWKILNNLINNNTKILDINDFKKILSYHHAAKPDYASSGDIYNKFTFQSIIFSPNKPELFIAFHSNGKPLENRPHFEQIELKH